MKLHWKNIEIEIPIVMLAMILAAGLFDREFILWSFMALFPHEMGHCLAAKRMGFKVERLKVQLFGASMQLSRPLYGFAEIVVAAAGPVASVCGATLVAGLIWFIPQADFLTPFIGASLSLALVNCLPALPLDGGRVLRAWLCQISERSTANRISTGLGIATGAFLIGIMILKLYLGSFNMSLCIMGLFVLSGSFHENKNNSYNAAAGVLRRQDAIRSRGTMRLETIAVHQRTVVRKALKNLRGATLLAVVDDEMQLMGTLAEGDLLRGMANGKSEDAVGTLLR